MVCGSELAVPLGVGPVGDWEFLWWFWQIWKWTLLVVDLASGGWCLYPLLSYLTTLFSGVWTVAIARTVSVGGHCASQLQMHVSRVLQSNHS